MNYMTYEQLVAWAQEHGKTAQDLNIWLASSDTQSIRDMNDKEMVEWLLDGIHYNDAHFKEWWEGFGEGPAQEVFLQHIKNEWKVT